MNIKDITRFASNELFEELIMNIYDITEKEKCISVMKNLKKCNSNIFLHFFNRFYRNGVTLMYGVDSLYTTLFLIDFIICETDENNITSLEAKLVYSVPIKLIFEKSGFNFLKNVRIDPFSKMVNDTKLRIFSLEDLQKDFNVNALNFSTLNIENYEY